MVAGGFGAVEPLPLAELVDPEDVLFDPELAVVDPGEERFSSPLPIVAQAERPTARARTMARRVMTFSGSGRGSESDPKDCTFEPSTIPAVGPSARRAGGVTVCRIVRPRNDPSDARLVLRDALFRPGSPSGVGGIAPVGAKPLLFAPS